MSILKYAYLLDKDNYIVENKVFIDLMWYIVKNRNNGPGKPKGIVTITKNGKTCASFKNFVIRNAGVMFQQIFYWHYNAVKKGNPTRYQYKGINVVKMDFEDWWNAVRLTESEIASANKLLLQTGLVDIHKMRIQISKTVFKPSNCYELKLELLEKYLDKIVEINKVIYNEKVTKVREKNNKTSITRKQKIEDLSTGLSTNKDVTHEPQVTLNLDGLKANCNYLSTESTESTGLIGKKNKDVTPETRVTKDTPETQVTNKATPKRQVTNITNTSNTSSTNTSEGKDSPLSDPEEIWYKISLLLKSKLSDVSFNTWIKEGIKDVNFETDTLVIKTINDFSKQFIGKKYSDLILKSTRSICNTIKKIKIEVV